MSDELRHAISRLKGQQPGPDRTPPDTLARMLPISAAIAGEREAARREAEEESKNLQIGRLAPGRGIFFGTMTRPDLRGIARTFNLFADLHDLREPDENGNGRTLIVTFQKAVSAVNRITNLWGHKGASYGTEKYAEAFYRDLDNGVYGGEWIIPPTELLNGTDKGGTAVQNDHLFRHKDTGAFKDSYTTPSMRDEHWYWSCTEPPGEPTRVYGVQLSNSNKVPTVKTSVELSCRLVRLEPQP